MLDLIHAYENYLTKVRKASGNTVSSYLRDIRQFASWLEQGGKADILQTTREDVVDYFAYLYQQGKSGATASRSLASMRNFFAYLQSTGFLETSPITSDVHVDRGEKRLPQILTGKEVELLLAQPSMSEPKGLRDKAMLELMYAGSVHQLQHCLVPHDSLVSCRIESAVHLHKRCSGLDGDGYH